MIWWLIFINFFAWCDDRTLLIAFILLYNETLCLFDQFCYIIQLLHILSIDFILFTIIMYSSYGSLHIMNAIAIATWLAWIMIVKRNKIILKLKLYFLLTPDNDRFGIIFWFYCVGKRNTSRHLGQYFRWFDQGEVNFVVYICLLKIKSRKVSNCI